MKKERTAQSESDGSADATTKPTFGPNEEILTMEPVKDTPFTIVKMEDQYFVAMGKYRLSKPTISKEEAMDDAKDASWDRIMQVIQIMIDENGNKTQAQEATGKAGSNGKAKATN